MTLTVTGLQWLERAILVYFALMNSAYLIFSVVAAFALIAHQRRVRSRAADVNAFGEAAFRPISVIVPARNEEATIAANVRALLTMRYPEFEIVVVSDGSTDHTLQVLRDAFDLVPAPQATRRQLETNPIRLTYVSRDHMNLRVIDKVGGGKSDALNAGLNAAKYPFVCNIDADSLLEPDALLRVARILGEDEDVDAVGGIIRVLNGSTVKDGRVVDVSTEPKPIVLCQTLEYLRGFLAGRTALGAANSLLIISGAFGVFRKKALFEAGGYSVGTVCEDMELDRAPAPHRARGTQGRQDPVRARSRVLDPGARPTGAPAGPARPLAARPHRKPVDAPRDVHEPALRCRRPVRRAVLRVLRGVRPGDRGVRLRAGAGPLVHGAC